MVNVVILHKVLREHLITHIGDGIFNMILPPLIL